MKTWTFFHVQRLIYVHSWKCRWDCLGEVNTDERHLSAASNWAEMKSISKLDVGERSIGSVSNKRHARSEHAMNTEVGGPSLRFVLTNVSSSLATTSSQFCMCHRITALVKHLTHCFRCRCVSWVCYTICMVL